MKHSSNTDIRKELTAISCYNDFIDDIDKEKKKLDEDRKNFKNKIQETIDNDFVKQFINEQLQYSIDKNNLNASKDSELYNVSVMSFTTGEGVSTQEYKKLNPNGIFRPFEDEWELWDIETKEEDDKTFYKITVDNIKGRKHILALCYEPDLYSTEWFV